MRDISPPVATDTTWRHWVAFPAPLRGERPNPERVELHDVPMRPMCGGFFLREGGRGAAELGRHWKNRDCPRGLVGLNPGVQEKTAAQAELLMASGVSFCSWLQWDDGWFGEDKEA